MEVSCVMLRSWSEAETFPGIVPKVSQSVITAAFLFAFKDVLYGEYSRVTFVIGHISGFG